MKELRLLLCILLSAGLLACEGQPTDEEQDLADEALLRSLTVDQNSFEFLLDESEIVLSGDCNVLHGNVILSIDSNEFTSSCSGFGSWQISLSHAELDAIGNVLSLSLTQANGSDVLDVEGLNETLQYVCDNSSDVEISNRGLSLSCNGLEVAAIQAGSGVTISEDILPEGCEPNCPEIIDGALEFEGGDEPVVLLDSPALQAEEELTVFLNIRWDGSVMNLSGQPASLLLEKGSSDDDNYGLYVWNKDKRFCFEYNTASLAYRSHCVTNQVGIDESHSVAVVFSYADQEVRLYVDGAFIQAFAETEKLRNNSHPLIIGQQNYPYNEFEFIGAIGDLTVLNSALSDDQIALLHNYTNQ